MARAVRILKLPTNIIMPRNFPTNSSFFDAFNSNFHKLPVRWVTSQMQIQYRGFAVVNSAKIQQPKNESFRKRRLDEICVERFQEYSRTFIQSWILQGKVFVDGKVVNKAGTSVSEKAVVEIRAKVPKYVCRAGHKLEAAIEEFGIDVSGKVALDSGLSTGGFTDCLLQYGASFVYGVDVGYGQVVEKIRRDERVCVIERTNLRYLSELPQKVDLVTLDLSFISILLVGKGGIVKDPLVHQEVIEKIIKGVENFGFTNKGWIESPIKGAEGNTEFVAYFIRTTEKSAE
ncbi:Putative rRNA methyltransferase YqxC [Morus notabilis]|uniref:Putative rRNA methyltransferase YqxC n=1 Tax=Morus notabilis TaxID=981085 RepID=W9RMR1_9ROSA|nr:Putative rRNA methyltransferase YqxC [Morus notabilis]